MKTAAQFNMAKPVIAADRGAEVRCPSPGPRCAIIAAAVTAGLASCSLLLAPAVLAQGASDSIGELLEGKAAFGDWRSDAPLVRRKITELPPPYATRSAANPPRVIAKPATAAPKVPPGFQVELFAANLRDPRVLRVAPNGDIFIAESEPGRIRVLRAADGADKPSSDDVFASGLVEPFGIAFYPPGPDPQWVYVANTGSVVRYPYRSGDLRARGKPEVIVRDLARAGGRAVGLVAPGTAQAMLRLPARDRRGVALSHPLAGIRGGADGDEHLPAVLGESDVARNVASLH